MMKDKTRNLVVIIMVTIIVIVLGVLGASYAYFAGGATNNSITNLLVKSNTIDELLFSKGNELAITANQDNFAQGQSDRSGSTTSTVTLTAKNDSASTYYYRAYIIISANTYQYTNGSTPELVLTVTKNGTTIINNMDITTTVGTIDIPVTAGGSAIKQPITASAGTTTVDSWTATVTFKNLNTDQSANASKIFRAVFYVEESPTLPAEYRELYYVESTGSQYIDTTLTPNQNTTALIDFRIPVEASGANCLFGTRNGSAGKNAMTFFKGSSLQWAYSFGNQNNASLGTYDTNRHIIRMEGRYLYMDEQLKTTLGTVSNFTGVYSAYLLGYNNSSSGTIAGRFKGYLYKCRMFDSGNLERNFIPAQRISDSKVGLYETVYGVFYEPLGGNLVAGTTVS